MLTRAWLRGWGWLSSLASLNTLPKLRPKSFYESSPAFNIFSPRVPCDDRIVRTEPELDQSDWSSRRYQSLVLCISEVMTQSRMMLQAILLDSLPVFLHEKQYRSKIKRNKAYTVVAWTSTNQPTYGYTSWLESVYVLLYSYTRAPRPGAISY